MSELDLKDIQIKIENPKGSYKSFGDNPDYPLKGVTYPTDYGSISGYLGEDGDNLDVFVGSGEQCGYIRVWRLDVPQETKTLMRLTAEELQQVLEVFKPVLLEHKVLSTEDFLNFIGQFKRK